MFTLVGKTDEQLNFHSKNVMQTARIVKKLAKQRNCIIVTDWEYYEMIEGKVKNVCEYIICSNKQDWAEDVLYCKDASEMCRHVDTYNDPTYNFVIVGNGEFLKNFTDEMKDVISYDELYLVKSKNKSKFLWTLPYDDFIEEFVCDKVRTFYRT